MVDIKTKAIILKKIPYGDGDWIVTLLTEEGQKVTGFAAKARVSKKRFGTSLDLFNYVEIVCRERRSSSMLQVSSSELLSGMEGLRQDLKKFAASCYFAELIIVFLQDKEKHEELFTIYKSFLEEINICDTLENQLIPVMEHRFLEIFGFKPTLNACMECGQSLNPEAKYFFNGMKGGIICLQCIQQGSHDKRAFSGEFNESNSQPLMKNPRHGSYPLSYSAISRLVESHQTTNNPSTTSWDPQEISQARRAFEYFLQYTAGKPFKSLQFLSKVLN